MNRFEPKMRELYAVPIGFSDGKQPIHLTEAQIQEAEERLGSRLPEDYREFVRDFGAFSLDALFPVREGCLSQAGVGYFSRAFDLVSHYLERDPQWFPDDAINIAMGGNIPVFLFFKGEKKGKVYIRDYDDFCLVADSFTEFMQVLENEFNETDMEAESIAKDAAPFWNYFSTQ